MKQEHNLQDTETLYLKMLKIGSECISCGTNFKLIKERLIEEKYFDKNEDDTILLLMFEESF